MLGGAWYLCALMSREMQLRPLDVIEVDPDVRELLARWAISPAVPVNELTAEAVREDDGGVLALQRTPGALHSVEDVDVRAQRARCPFACTGPARDGCIPSCSCTAAAS